MADQGFFLALSGLGVSLAGFAGLIHALDRSLDKGDAVAKWRIRNVVSEGFGIALAGTLVWAAFSLSGDEALTVRIVSGFMLMFFLYLIGPMGTFVRAVEDLRHNTAAPDNSASS